MSQSSGLPTTGKMPGKSDIKITLGEMRESGVRGEVWDRGNL
jgi:hypothetical protein